MRYARRVWLVLLTLLTTLGLKFWGYLYHLDAMQQVSFPDINSKPETQAVVPPMKMVPIPGIPPRPGEIDPKTASAWPLPGRSCG